MKIYKYPVPIADYFTITLPQCAEILSFQTQNDEMMIWAAVNPENLIEDRRFSVIGTGHNINMDEVKKFIGTAQLMNGKLAWHLFEMK